MPHGIKGSAPICSVDGCARISKCRGLCDPHHHKFRKYGDPTVVLKRSFPRGEPLKFLQECIATRDRSTGCWEWPYGVGSHGYGTVNYNQSATTVPSLALILDGSVRPPKPNNFILHACDNRLCFNPACLRWGTQKENIAEAWTRGRMTAQKGVECHKAKLTEEQVLAIREDWRVLRVIAAEYGISDRSVSAIRLRQTWKHL